MRALRGAATGVVIALFAAPAAHAQDARDVLPLVATAIETIRDQTAAAVAPAAEQVRATLPRRVLLRGTVVTMDDARRVIERGRVLVAGSQVVAVWQDDHVPAGVTLDGVPVVDGDYVLPGLINLHDHPTYDTLPLWQPPQRYSDRYQWNGPDGPLSYRRLVANPRNALASTDALGLDSQIVKYAELRAALSGTTATQGAGPDPATDGLLVRNVDQANFGRDRVESRVTSVDDPGFAEHGAPPLAERMRSGQVDAWLVHLAEGVRDGDLPPGAPRSPRAEFDTVRRLGLLADPLVVLHGTGLERADFAAMAAAGADLVWSPLSNLLLYGTTTHVDEALAEGVNVALGTDWTPSGSGTLLGELKQAELVLERQPYTAAMPAEQRDRLLVEMVTRNPARALHWQAETGSIAAGKAADLLVLDRPARFPTGGAPATPYRALIDATERDVRLTMVGGDPVAGDVDVLGALKPADNDVVASAHGTRKAVDITRLGVPEGLEHTGRLRNEIRAVQARLGAPSWLRRHWDRGRWLLDSDAAFGAYLAGRFPAPGGAVNLGAMPAPPLFTEDDEALLGSAAGRAVAERWYD